MQGEKVHPDDDQSSKDQSSDQTGRDSSDSVLQKPIIRISKVAQQVSNTQRPVEDCVSRDRIKQRTVAQVVSMHAQHDVHTEKMEQSKIIKNTVQRKNPIIQEKINQVRCKAKFAALKPCRNRGRATPVEDVPVDTQRSGPTMQKAPGAVHRRDSRRSQ